jgi:hypothetical protein
MKEILLDAVLVLICMIYLVLLYKREAVKEKNKKIHEYCREQRDLIDQKKGKK